ncbi:MAG: acylphosphatase [Candidatus Nitrosocaldus sp.]
MKRVKVFAEGMVQGVGYRYNVKHIAMKHKVKGYVKNLDDGRVEIVAEGDDEPISRFLEDIRIRREPIYVEDMDVRYEEPTGEFKTFKIITGSLEEEMTEGFSTGALYFNVMLAKQDQMLAKQDQMLNKQDQMLAKQDQMLNKQDQMLAKQDQMLAKQDQMLNKQDQMLAKQDQTLGKLDEIIHKIDDAKTGIINEIRMFRSDMKSMLDERLARIEEDIAKIKARLGMV